MPDEISAGHLFPVPRFVHGVSPDAHRALLAEAINEVAAAAFSLDIQGASDASSQDISGSSYTQYSSLTLSLVTPVQAFAFIMATIVATPLVFAAGAGELDLRIVQDGVVKTAALWEPSAATEVTALSWSFVLAVLEPQTVYTITIKARVKPTGAGTNTYRLNPSVSADEATLGAVVAPRRL